MQELKNNQSRKEEKKLSGDFAFIPLFKIDLLINIGKCKSIIKNTQIVLTHTGKTAKL